MQFVSFVYLHFYEPHIDISVIPFFDFQRFYKQVFFFFLDSGFCLRSERMNDWASLGIGSIGGAVFSKLLKVVIDEAKKFKAFKPLSKDLVSTMEILFPLTQKIDSMQKELDFGVKELKELRDTIERADVAVRKFPRVKWYEKSKYTRKLRESIRICLSSVRLIFSFFSIGIS
ncbi:putative powdery mildew resistance protein, RPW8 [Arabidopsis thaliana]